MSGTLSTDEDLVQRLPLPLAQIYRRAHNAKSPLERHHQASYLWEASLKLLASVAIVEYAELGDDDPELEQQLHNLARPQLGHWWSFVRRLLPVLAEAQDPALAPYRRLREIILGRTRHDLPRAAGLYAAVRHALYDESRSRTTVRLTELYDDLVAYRNSVAHGALDSWTDAEKDRMSRALLLGVSELLGHVDVLAGRRLIFIDSVEGQATGEFLIKRSELTGEAGKQLESIRVPQSDAGRLPRRDRVYIESQPGGAGAERLCSLHPLIVCDPESWRVYFLNGRKGQRKAEYLCYSSGDRLRRDDLDAEHRELLSRILGSNVAPDEVEEWAKRSQGSEAPAKEADESPHPGRTVGEFELLSFIGSGAMGAVYRAWQPSLGRQVALKLCLRSGDPQHDRRFLREITALGRVDHPNLVKIYTSGSDAEQWFYAMELIEGATLDSICGQLAGSDASKVTENDWQHALRSACDAARSSEKPLNQTDPATGSTCAEDHPTAESTSSTVRDIEALGIGASGDRNHIEHAVETIRQVATATDALHTKAGGVHRDIKPGNIMLTREGTHAVLLDLGLVQIADSMERSLTRTQQFVGTLRYASPEQVLCEELTRRSDIYSLGATLWELLTLRPLYGPQCKTPEHLRRAILMAPPERPSKHNPRIPRDLDDIVLKALAKEPQLRYYTAGELAQDLQRWQNNEPVVARPPSVAYVLRKYIQRHWLPIAAAAALLLALILGSTVAGVSWFAAQIAGAKTRVEDALQETKSAYNQLEDQKQKTDLANLQLQQEQRRTEAANTELSATIEALETSKTQLEETQLELQLKSEEARRRAFVMALRDAQALEQAGDRFGSLVWIADALEMQSEAGETAPTAADDPATGEACRTARDVAASLRQWLTNGLNQSPELLQVWPGGGPVTGLSFSPSGSHLLAADDDKGERLRDLSLAQTRQLTAPATNAAAGRMTQFSADGTRVLTVGGDGKARIWDVQQAALVTALPHPHRIEHADLRSDGRAIIAVDSRQNLLIWEVGQSKPGVVSGEDWIHGAFSANGSRLMGSTLSATYIWDADQWFTKRRGGSTAAQQRQRAAGIPAADGPGDRWGTGPRPQSELRRSDEGAMIVAAHSPASGESVVTIARAIDSGMSEADWLSSGIYGEALSSLEERSLPLLDSEAALPFEKSVKIWRRDVAPKPRDQQLSSPMNALEVSSDHSIVIVGSEDGTSWVSMGGDVRTSFSMTHDDDVNVIRFSPDGALAVTGSDDYSAQIWNVRTGEHQVPPLTHTDAVYDARFSPDGSLLATLSGDGSFRVWNVADGSLRFLPEDQEGVASIAFFPGGQLLATAHYDLQNHVKLWNTESGELIESLAHDAGVTELAFSPQGTYLAIATEDGALYLRDPETREVLQQLQLEDACNHLAFSHSEEIVAATQEGGTVQLWEVEFARPRGRVLQHEGIIYDLIFSHDDRWLATASADSTARVWETEAGRLAAELRHADEVNSVRFSPNDLWLLTGDDEGTAKLWDIASERIMAVVAEGLDLAIMVDYSSTGSHVAAAGYSGKAQIAATLAQPRAHSDAVNAAAISRDGRLIATAGADGTVFVWNAVTRQHVVEWDTGYEPVRDVTFDATGRYLAAACWDDAAYVWDVETGQQTAVLLHEDDVNAVAFSPDGQLLVSGSDDGAAIVWRIATETELTRVPHEDWVMDVAFSPDGRLIATASDDDIARLWDVERQEMVAQIEHDSDVAAVRFSRDGSLLATSSDDGQLQLFDMQKRTVRWSARQPVMAFVSLDFNQDGALVAVGSTDGAAYVWDTATGQLRSRLKHGDGIVRVGFSGAGDRMLVTAGNDGRLIDWELARKDWVAETASDDPVDHVVVVGRSLLLADREHYLEEYEFSLIDIESGATRWEFAVPGSESELYQVALSPDGTMLAVSDDTGVRLWDVRRQIPVTPLLRHDGPARHLAFSPDGRLLATGGDDGAVCLWGLQPRIGAPMAPADHALPLWIAVDPTGTRAVALGEHGRLQLFRTDSGELLGPAFRGSEFVNRAWFSPLGSHIVSADELGRLDVWQLPADPREPAPQRIWTEKHAGGIAELVFSADGERFLTRAPGSEIVRLWQISAAGEQIAELAGTAPVSRMAFCGESQQEVLTVNEAGYTRWKLDGSELRVVQDTRFPANERARSSVLDIRQTAIVVADRTRVRVQDLVTGNESSVVHEGATHAAIAPDGRTLVTAGPRLVRIWDLPSGARRGEPLDHSLTLNGLLTGCDGTLIAWGGSEVRVWNLATALPIAYAMRCSRPISRLAFNDQSGELFTIEDRQTLRRWAIGAPAAERPQELSLEVLQDYTGLRVSPESFTLTAEAGRFRDDWRSAYRGDEQFRLADADLNECFCYLHSMLATSPSLVTDSHLLDLESRLSTSDQRAQWYAVRGHFAMAAANHTQAIDLYRQAAQFAPGDDRIQYYLATAYVEAGDAQFAETALREAADLNPDNPMYEYGLGLLRYRANSDDDALDDFSRVLEDSPGHVGALFHRAAIYKKREDWSAFVQDAAQLVQLTGISNTVAPPADEGSSIEEPFIVDPLTDLEEGLVQATAESYAWDEEEYAEELELAYAPRNLAPLPTRQEILEQLQFVPKDKDKEVLQHLEHLIDADEPSVAIWSIQVLLSLDQISEAVRSKLEQWTEPGVDPALRETAMQALLQHPADPDDWLRLVRKGLRDADKALRLRVMQSVAQRTDFDLQSLVPVLLERLGEEISEPEAALILRLLRSAQPRSHSQQLLVILEGQLAYYQTSEARLEAIQLIESLEDPPRSLAPALREMSSDPDYSVRSAAARMLVLVDADSEETVETLLQLFASDPLPEVRLEAVRAMGQLGADAAATAVPMLIAGGDAADWRIRQAVADVMPQFVTDQNVDEVAGFLGELLGDEDIDVRQSAVASLTRIGSEFGLPESLVPGLLNHSNTTVRQAALSALPDLGIPRAAVVAAIRQAIQDDIAEIRSEAVRQLGRLADQFPDAVSLLAEVLDEHRDSETGQAVLEAAAAIGRPAAQLLPLLLPFVEDIWQVRQALADALPALVTPDNAQEVVTQIASLLGDDDSDVRDSAFESLRKLVDRIGVETVSEIAIPRIEEIVVSADPSIRAAAMRALRLLVRDAEARVAAYRTSLQSPDSDVQLTALQELVDLSPMPPELLSDLEAVLRAPEGDETVRLWAAYAIGQYKGEAEAQLPMLLVFLAEQHPTQVLCEAAGAVWNIESAMNRRLATDRVIQTLIKGLDDEGSRQSAARILSDMGIQAAPATEALIRCLDKLEYWETTSLGSVAQALGNIGPLAAGVLPKLEEAFRDGDANLREKIVNAAGNIGDTRGLRLIDQALEDENAGIRALACLARWRITGEEPIDVQPLKDALGSSDANARKLAAEVVTRIGVPAAELLDPLAGALDDEAAVVVEWVADALGKLGPLAHGSLPKLRELTTASVSDTARNWTPQQVRPVRQWAAYALGEIRTDPKLNVERLAALLSDDDQAVSRYAAEALGKYGSYAVEAANPLADALQADDATLRSSAADALAEIAPQVLVEVAEKALQEDPNSLEFVKARGHGQAWLRNWPEAIESYQAVLAQNPADLSIQPKLLRCQLAAGAWEAFRERFRSFLFLSDDAAVNSLPPLAPDDRVQLARVAVLADTLPCSAAELLEQFRPALEQNPRNSATLSAHGAALYRLGRYQEAIDQLKQAIERRRMPLSREAEDARDLVYLAWSHRQLDQSADYEARLAEARALIQRTLSDDAPGESRQVRPVDADWELRFDLQRLQTEAADQD